MFHISDQLKIVAAKSVLCQCGSPVGKVWEPLNKRTAFISASSLWTLKGSIDRALNGHPIALLEPTRFFACGVFCRTKIPTHKMTPQKIHLKKDDIANLQSRFQERVRRLKVSISILFCQMITV